MDSIKKNINQPIVAGVVGLVIGLIIGWFVIGWGLWPVEWTDAYPADLTQSYQEEYMRMSIDSFAVNGDAALAQTRYQSLGEDAGQIYQTIMANPAGQSTEVIAAYGAVVGAGMVPPTAEAGAEPTPVVPEVADEGSSWGSIILIICVIGVFLLLAAAGGYYYFYMRKGKQDEDISTMPVAEEKEAEFQTPGEVAVPAETTEMAPVSKFETSYTLGDELYDESFSIDSPTGEFLGECGVGVSETIGVGDTQKVTAFEVWLFDKNDIQTVTKVLMSTHAYQDENVRMRLAAKGDPLLVTPGSSTILETQTLRMEAHVVALDYGNGAMPPESYFERFDVELTIWAK
jgi:hypothetical protein